MSRSYYLEAYNPQSRIFVDSLAVVARQLLAATGMRPDSILNVGIGSFHPGSHTITWRETKQGENFTIALVLSDYAYFTSALEELGNFGTTFRTYYQLRRSLLYSYSFPRIFPGAHECLYLYRYIKTKMLIDEGKTDAEIQLYFKHSSSAVTASYITNARLLT